jgi:hypothetical protein
MNTLATYQDLVVRHGNLRAFYLLLTLERLAQIKNDIVNMDEDVRFQRALEALNHIDFAVV